MDRPPPSSDTSRVTPLAQAFRFAGAGLELGGMALAVAAIGYAIDRHYQHTTLVATAIGTLIGFSAGMYRFIRQATAASRPSTNHHANHRATDADSGDDQRSGDPAGG